jgi:hypothetical protein
VSDATTPTCESCGAPDGELETVERLYLDPDDPQGGEPRPGGVERWCVACRATYPHQAPPD